MISLAKVQNLYMLRGICIVGISTLYEPSMLNSWFKEYSRLEFPIVSSEPSDGASSYPSASPNYSGFELEAFKTMSHESYDQNSTFPASLTG